MGVFAANTIRQGLRCALTGLALPIVSCSSSPDKPVGDNIAVITGAATPAARARPAAAKTTPLPTAAPVPTPTSFADMHPHKSFVDPPLPPELRAHVPASPVTANGASPTH